MEKNKPKKNRKLNIAAFIILFIAVVVGVCNSKNDKKTLKNDEVVNAENRGDTIMEPFGNKDEHSFGVNGGISKIIYKTNYKIIEESNLSNIKYTYEIRLSNNKLTKEELGQLAKVLKDKLDKNYERIFISYYLPDINVGSGAWAISHFDPDLSVAILGRTSQEEKNTNDDCELKIYKLISISEGIEESIEMVEDYYEMETQKKFEDLVEGLLDVVQQTNIQDKKDIGWAISCCPDTQVYLEKAMTNLEKFTKEYINVYANGKKNINVYKERIKENLRKANNALKKCK